MESAIGVESLNTTHIIPIIIYTNNASPIIIYLFLEDIFFSFFFLFCSIQLMILIRPVAIKIVINKFPIPKYEILTISCHESHTSDIYIIFNPNIIMQTNIAIIVTIYFKYFISNPSLLLIRKHISIIFLFFICQLIVFNS